MAGVAVLLLGLFPVLSLPLTAAPTVNVSFSGTQATSLQNDFMSSATNQFVGVITKSTYFPDTYSISITGKKQYTPPTSEIPVTFTSTGTYIVKVGEESQTVYQSTMSISDLIAYGFADGMESERKDDIRLIAGLKNDIFLTKTCGGLVSGSTVPANAFLLGCEAAYNVATSTITQRDGLAPQAR